VKAFVVLTPLYNHIHDDIVKAEELIRELQDFVKKGTGPYKYPRAIEFVKELPKTVSGKIRRVELRAREWAGHTKDGTQKSKL
jgi:medium-chain acyl-CoA synthetase